MASVSDAIPAVNSTAPSVSGRAPASSRTSPSRREAAMNAATPIGTLTMNTHRQPACTSSPPMGGPAAAATPPTAAQIPTAAPRFSGGNSGSSRPSEVGSMNAAPAACATRAPTSTATDGAAAHAAEARLNRPSPSRKPRLRPARSAHRPAGTSSAAKVIAYAFRTQDRPARLTPVNSRWMSGKAMLTMNRSSEAMKTPIDTVSVTFVRRDITGLSGERVASSNQHIPQGCVMQPISLECGYAPLRLHGSELLDRPHPGADRRALDDADRPRGVPRHAPVRRVPGQAGHRPQRAADPARAIGGGGDPAPRALPGAPGPLRVPPDPQGHGPVAGPRVAAEVGRSPRGPKRAAGGDRARRMRRRDR